ncbi:TetR family transcriptional regulator [Kineosporia sp. NBRC 101731]|uniref:TetR/AcrR family transcriptional regulator n=1 Tax=Kineosporia sp. NBRC 101731 TaxID=3032199 RepID=UPI0024A13205|nr:TetR family transcriptional regulator [Kineosporia sp. NBRC 101731]GLY29192.1 DNA-binding protein [Kineosporia sp. NBRC 101731]
MSRTYRSDLRGQQAEDTRRRILEVAAGKFAQDGYAATSVRQLAVAAGVSVNTLYAIGGKPEIFLKALVQVIDDEEGARLVDRPEVVDLFAVAEPVLNQVLVAQAALITAANDRSAKLWAAFEEGANTDAYLAVAYGQEAEKMRADSRRGLDRLVRAGICAAPADPDRTADLLWAAGHPRNYDVLVRQAGWAPTDFQEWLVGQWMALLAVK